MSNQTRQCHKPSRARPKHGWYVQEDHIPTVSYLLSKFPFAFALAAQAEYANYTPMTASQHEQNQQQNDGIFPFDEIPYLAFAFC